ncbi:PPE family protein [Mycobacterium stomatepiae]|uniref:PPE family protein n=1 Tax=Mycobacterium stomatepiae TaxID=470076 RepID=A0A7I7QEQ9_9MYCO|nr:PPE family protein [Mycobacterium stomatepiae]MCV7167102.1 PPE family protein [Mycobacterium stomatepiae]BBY24844.1 PPE family protein [Mycobacterium stomatepiae]
MDFGALPPEINSARMYAGPGPASLTMAAVAWTNLATELHSAAGSYRSLIAGLTTGRWLGPTSLTMASAFGPYVAWMSGAAARAEEAASHATLAVEIYEAAFAMTVPPPVVTANRIQLATLMSTNFFGQNSAAIAANEAEYGEMWAQDAAAMYQYAGNSVAVCDVSQFNIPPKVTDDSGLVAQSNAVSQAAAATGLQHADLANLVSQVPTTMQSLTTPATSTVSTGTSTAVSDTLTNLAAQVPNWLPNYLNAGATPLYGMSSVLSMAQTAQGMARTAAESAAAAAQGAASGAASAASALPNIGSGVIGSLGTAAHLGPMSVPTAWTSVIPNAPMAASALPNIALNGSSMPNMLGGLPMARGTAPRTPPVPRYGLIPTAMARPFAAG